MKSGKWQLNARNDPTTSESKYHNTQHVRAKVVGAVKKRRCFYGDAKTSLHDVAQLFPEQMLRAVPGQPFTSYGKHAQSCIRPELAGEGSTR